MSWCWSSRSSRGSSSGLWEPPHASLLSSMLLALMADPVGSPDFPLCSAVSSPALWPSPFQAFLRPQPREVSKHSPLSAPQHMRGASEVLAGRYLGSHRAHLICIPSLRGSICCCVRSLVLSIICLRSCVQSLVVSSVRVNPILVSRSKLLVIH